MNIWSVVSDIFALTPEQEIEYHQSLLDEGLIEPTPAEQAQIDVEETANYVEWISSMGTWRETWYTGDNETGYTFHWEEQVFDQNNHKHVVESGSQYVGYWYDWNFTPTDLVSVYQGEVVNEYVPVYMRLQG